MMYVYKTIIPFEKLDQGLRMYTDKNVKQKVNIFLEIRWHNRNTIDVHMSLVVNSLSLDIFIN